jgi:hypothetical protein
MKHKNKDRNKADVIIISLPWYEWRKSFWNWAPVPWLGLVCNNVNEMTSLTDLGGLKLPNNGPRTVQITYALCNKTFSTLTFKSLRKCYIATRCITHRHRSVIQHYVSTDEQTYCGSSQKVRCVFIWKGVAQTNPDLCLGAPVGCLLEAHHCHLVLAFWISFDFPPV